MNRVRWTRKQASSLFVATVVAAAVVLALGFGYVSWVTVTIALSGTFFLWLAFGRSPRLSISDWLYLVGCSTFKAFLVFLSWRKNWGGEMLTAGLTSLGLGLL